MSHFSVSVITKKDPNTDEGRAELDRLLAPYDENTTDPKIVKFVADEDCEIDDLTKSRGYWENPQAKWDWYAAGPHSRWHNTLPSLSGKTAGEKLDTLPIYDVDLSVNPDQYQAAIRFWDVVVNGMPLKDDETPDQFRTMWKASYYINRHGTKENYAKECATFNSFALVTVDGDWLEKGRMRFWGMADVSKDDRDTFNSTFHQILKDHPNDYLTLVDCHI